MSIDYKSTLKLPKTDFPMRAALAKREPQILKFWDDLGLYQKMMERRDPQGPSFMFHDGPPYANGEIHIGHALNKGLKDFIFKYKNMRGYYCPYIPGWDTHGLPIELKVLQTEKVDKDHTDPLDLRKRCEAYARKYMAIQRDGMIRMGCLSDWDHPYLTLHHGFEARELGVLADMIDRGLIYRGTKPVYWCTDCHTALAAAEIEYGDETSPSVYVAYSLDDLSDRYPVLKGLDVNVVVWTTTPWTLPASQAVALNPSFDYGFYQVQDKVYLVARGLASSVSQATGLTLGEPLLVLKGQDLELVNANHPYLDRKTPLLMADYVTLESGTGCVHTAPAHGVEDYETGMRYRLETYNPVDDRGVFYPETPLVGGLSVDNGSKLVIKTLQENGRLLGLLKITHSYPHCWRCHKPVIFRSTAQWFVDVAKFRDQALTSIDRDVQWIPGWGRDRIYNMVRDRSDWCISRQRIWGVPIPAFDCPDCGQTVLTADRVRRIQSLVAQEGCDVWWARSPEELLGDLAVCPHCGGHHLRKGQDILDVWFDSGSSHLSVLETRPEVTWPADLYLEGSDQHRGWFQTSLLTSVAVTGRAPYRGVLTHGFIVDEEGRKMSKSLQNGVAPQRIVDQNGADVLRLWVASTDYRSDIRISDNIIARLADEYRRIRNTARFLLGNLSGFDPRRDRVDPAQMSSFDRWALSRLHHVIKKVTEGYDAYEFHLPMVTIHQFCVNELSSLYLEVNKDRLYADQPQGTARRSCQTVMWDTLVALTKMLAPILSFTAEEIWQQLRGIDESLEESVLLCDWPSYDLALCDDALEAQWNRILDLRTSVTKALEASRAAGKIGQSLEAAVTVAAPQEYQDLLSLHEWDRICITSGFQFAQSLEEPADERGIAVRVSPAKGTKCPRCWRYEETHRDDGLCCRCASVLTQD